MQQRMATPLRLLRRQTATATRSPPRRLQLRQPLLAAPRTRRGPQQTPLHGPRSTGRPTTVTPSLCRRRRSACRRDRQGPYCPASFPVLTDRGQGRCRQRTACARAASVAGGHTRRRWGRARCGGRPPAHPAMQGLVPGLRAAPCSPPRQRRWAAQRHCCWGGRCAQLCGRTLRLRLHMTA